MEQSEYGHKPIKTESTGETPEQKAKRLGVSFVKPLPPLPTPQQREESNPLLMENKVVAVCECGEIKTKTSQKYGCGKARCPFGFWSAF